MKIVITVHSLKNYGGTESYTYTLAKELVQQGHEVFCFSLQLGEIAEMMRKEGVVVTNDLTQLPNKINFIHGQHKLETTLVCNKYPNTPAVFVSHGIIPWQEQPPLLKQIVRYIAVSEEIKEHIHKKYSIPNDKILIIRNGIDLERFTAIKPINDVPKKLLLLSNRYSDIVFQTISEACLSLNIEIHVVGQRGLVTWETEKEINNADIVVSLGRGVLEAAACKRFVIIYDYNGGDGVLSAHSFERFSKKNFSGRTERKHFSTQEFIQLINEYSKPMVNENYSYIKHSHDIKKIVSQLLDVYNLKLEEQNADSLNNINSDIINECFVNLMKDFEQKDKNILYLVELNEVIEKEKIKLRKEYDHMLNELKLIKKENTDLEKEIAKLKNELLEEKSINKELQFTHQNLIQKNMDYFSQLEQKEANTKFLLELNQEKDIKLNDIYNSKVWKVGSKYYSVKGKFQKAIKNPKLVLKKIIGKRSVPTSENKVQLNINDTDSPLISVVIPVYDRTDVLIESIESILNQTYQNFELIIVCDGSPKPTLDIVKKYENHEKVRVFYYYNNSGNAVRGRNKAIKEARGIYLAFQDSDDIATPDRLEISLHYIEKYNSDIVYGGWRALVDGSREIEIKNGEEIYSPDCDYNMLKEICVPCQSTVLLRLEAVRKVGGLKTNMRYREDHELWLRLAYNKYKFKSIPKILTNLRLHGSNLELSFKETDDHWFDLMLEEHKVNTQLTPKIAYVIPGCGISGGIAVICQHANRLLKKGLDVILITEDDKTNIDWFPNQLVEILPMEKAPDNLDIIVATGWSTAYTIQHMNAKRKLYFVQSDESRFYEKGTKMFKDAWDSYNFEYEYMTEAKWIKDWLKVTFGHDAHYVPNGLDENIIHQSEPIAAKGEKVRVLLEGPIDIPFKGMEDAFMAVNDLDCEVWCISSAGRPKSEWKCDRFFEKVPMEQMKNIYSSCDVLVKMSRVEGFFGPPLEMMACGGAVVVGEVTGYDEYIIDGYNALVVKQGDVNAAKNAIQTLITDNELRMKLIENGRKTADEWKWDPTIEILEKIYLKKETQLNV